MNKKRLLSILLAAIMMIGMLAGCASNASTVSGTLDEVKDFMFVIKADDGAYYSFPLDEDDEIDLSGFSAGDRVVVKYEGTLSEIDAFTGKLISVEK